MPAETASPKNSLLFISYSLSAAGLLYLAQLSELSSPFILIAFSPLLLFQASVKSTALQSLVIIPFLLVNSLKADGGLALFGALAWFLYCLGRPLWGKQRAFLAFLFLFISAESLPYYLGLPDYYSFQISSSISRLKFLKSGLNTLGYNGLSLLILLFNYGVAQLIISYQQHRKVSKLWIFTALISLLLPLVFSLNSDKSSLEELAQNSLASGLNGVDTFLARMSFFIAFFLLLFALVRKLLPEKNTDDRFT